MPRPNPTPEELEIDMRPHPRPTENMSDDALLARAARLATALVSGGGRVGWGVGRAAAPRHSTSKSWNRSRAVADSGYDVDRGSPPPWLHLLDYTARGWREKQILKGRNPDPYIEGQLRKAGLWPEK